MHLLVDGVGQAARTHGLAHQFQIENGGRAVGICEQSLRIRQDDRPRAGGADHRAADRTGRITYERADRMGKFAGLSARLVVAPARNVRQARNVDGGDDLQA